MKITEIAIKRGVTFTMIYLVVVGFGLFSLARLKLDLYPKMEFPIIAIISQYSGVGPFDIETVVTRPIEEVVATVENVEKITSETSQGLSLVTIEFAWGTDMNQAEIDVRNAMEWVQDIIPQDVSDPLIFAFDPSTQPIMYFAVTSQVHGPAELRKISEHDVEPRIERIPGVASAVTAGGMAREIQILVDPNRLRAHNIPIQQVTQALQMNNLQIPSGFIENEHQEFTVQTTGEYTSVDQIANTAVAQLAGSTIRVKDVANVVDGFKEQRQRIFAGGIPAVMLWVQKQSDANTVQVCKSVNSQLAQIESELPKGVKLENFFDFSSYINRSMANLGNTALQAILLAFVVLLFFLRNVRSSIIVALSIPVSIILTFAVMDQAGLTLNIISMAGLALAVGLLLDNSIVVLESIFRYREKGVAAAESANKGSSEVAMAITASTLTTLAVFVPILFVPGIAGMMFKEMVITICFSLAVSLVVALTLIPLLTSKFLKIEKIQNKKGRFGKFVTAIGNLIESWENFYVRRLDWSLKHRKTVLISTFVLFIVSLFVLFGRGGEFLPEGDDNFVTISVDRTPGVSLDQMENTIRQVDKIIDENVPEKELTFSSFGQGEGIFALFSARGSGQGDINVRLPRITKRDRNEDEIKDVLRGPLSKIPDATISFSDRGADAMFGSAGDIVIGIIGHDLQVAEALAYEMEAKVKNIKNVVHTEVSVKDARPEMLINLDRQRIADLGLSTSQVGQSVSTSILGTVVTRFREGGDEYDVRVQLAEQSRKNKEDLENILVMTPSGRQVPLRSIASIEYSKAPQQITREDQERYVSVALDVTGNDLRAATAAVMDVVNNTPIPNDFRVELGGTAEDMQESFLYLGLAMLVAVILTYMVMASQFESLLEPFIILFTIPLSLIGVAWGLLITRTTLSVMALIGIVMLVGIVVNNGIVLISYINQLREEGKGLYEAILDGGKIRMRPVLMTALTTILAMLPLALGTGESGESWAPMARSVMGGLTASAILTLVVVPIIYASLERFAEKRREKREARKQRRLEKKLAVQQA